VMQGVVANSVFGSHKARKQSANKSRIRVKMKKLQPEPELFLKFGC
jgi:hypothetical protein